MTPATIITSETFKGYAFGADPPHRLRAFEVDRTTGACRVDWTVVEAAVDMPLMRLLLAIRDNAVGPLEAPLEVSLETPVETPLEAA